MTEAPEATEQGVARKPMGLRLKLMLALLLAICIAGTADFARRRHDERQLHALAVETIDGYNAIDKEPLPAEGPEAEVTVDVTVSYAYLFFGEKTGKVTLNIHPAAHAQDTTLGGISYIYRHVDGAWVQEMSYHED